MISQKIIGLLLFGYTLVCTCMTVPSNSGFEDNKGEYKVKAYARMPKNLRESSGLITAAGGRFWTHQDSGNPSALYLIEANGAFVDTLQLSLPNTDWESLCRDPEGRIYIGDFGNNLNKRRDLRIFRLSPQSQTVDTIFFSYPDQTDFPPDRKNLNFDCEAFLWHGGRLHLFSKSYGNKIVKHYSLPDSAGTYEANLEEEFPVKGLVTGAALRPDGRELALLTYGRLYLFRLSEENLMEKEPYKCISLTGRAQTEAITYINNQNMLITNEQGRMIYVYQAKK